MSENTTVEILDLIENGQAYDLDDKSVENLSTDITVYDLRRIRDHIRVEKARTESERKDEKRELLVEISRILHQDEILWCIKCNKVVTCDVALYPDVNAEALYNDNDPICPKCKTDLESLDVQEWADIIKKLSEQE